MKHWFFKPCYFFIQVLWAYNLNEKVIYKSPFFKFFDASLHLWNRKKKLLYYSTLRLLLYFYSFIFYLIQNLSQLCDIILYIYPHKY